MPKPSPLHAEQRDKTILGLLEQRGFISFQEIQDALDASPATLRRDLERLARSGSLARVHGGAKLVEAGQDVPPGSPGLSGVPFQENIARNRLQKAAIGKAAAGLCRAGEAIMIDGGSTTLQMCPYLDGLNLQILTNSLHIVSALLPQTGTRISVPGGAVFREQNIILSSIGDELMPRFHAPKFFMGAAAVGPQGVMQADVVLVEAERRLIDKCEELILLVDSSKFTGSSGNVVCGLADVDVIVTDASISQAHKAMVNDMGIRLIIAS